MRIVFILHLIILISPLKLTSKDILSKGLTAFFNQNQIDCNPDSILDCLDEQTADQLVKFVTSSLSKGESGSPSIIISLIEDLHQQYNLIPSSIKQCLKGNEELLKLSYKYGIGYLPLAQQQFKTHVNQNYLNVHKEFGLVSKQWNSQLYYEAALEAASYAHIIYPIVKKNIRGVWLTNVASTALDSQSNIEKAVEQCYKAHLNTIYVVVYNNARTIYPSQVMYDLIGIKQQEKYQGRDPLQEVITAAKKYQIEVHAWFQYGFSSSYSAEGGPIIAKKPSWKALDVEGNLVVKNGFDWLNGFDPEVQHFMMSLIKQVVSNYEVQGVQGDDRLPALPSISGYQEYTISLYMKEHQGRRPPSDHLDTEWINWRANKLNDFMKQLYLEVKGLNPLVVVSVAPSPYPWSLNEYLQDWPTWQKYNWVDAVLPQCYRYSFEAYKQVLSQQVGFLSNPKTVFAPGILLSVGSYLANTTFLSSMVGLNRELELSGQSFFYYEGIVQQSEWFQTKYPLSDS